MYKIVFKDTIQRYENYKEMNMQYAKAFIAILISGLLLSGCDQSPKQSAKDKSNPHQVNSELLTIESSTVKRRFNGLIIAPNTIKISNQIDGNIISMPYRVGSVVNKGDVLVQLDSRLTKAEHLKALASLEKATQDLQRIKQLIPRQLASAEELSAATTEQKLAQANLTLKTIQLDRSTIKAPFSGVISERLFEPGDTVAVNTKLLTLVDKSSLIIKSAIPESFISYIFINKTVEIQIPSLALSLDGKISSIYPTVDSRTQQIPLEVSFTADNSQLSPGQFAQLIITHKTAEKILIPVNSVQYDTQGTWVYTIDSQQQAQQTWITTAQNLNNKIEVISGLKAGDHIITNGFIGLRPGKKVISETLLNSQPK